MAGPPNPPAALVPNSSECTTVCSPLLTVLDPPPNVHEPPLSSSFTDQLTSTNNRHIVLSPVSPLTFPSFSGPGENTANGQLCSSRAHVRAPRPDLRRRHLARSGALVQLPWLGFPAERLVLGVYIGSHVAIWNPVDVYIFLPNEPSDFTMCHQTFSLYLTGT